MRKGLRVRYWHNGYWRCRDSLGRISGFYTERGLLKKLKKLKEKIDKEPEQPKE